MSARSHNSILASPRLVCCAAIACFAACGVAQAQYPLQALVGVKRTVDRVEWFGFNAEGKLHFAAGKNADGTDGEQFHLPLRDLVTWGYPIEPGRGTHVLLVDGGVLPVETVSTDAETLQCSSAVLGPRTFALPQVRGIVFSGSGSRAARARLFDAVASSTTGDRDRLVTVRDDELTGTITSIDFRGVTMQTSLGPVVLELGQAAYLVFNPALAAPPAASADLRVLVGLRDGGLLNCAAVAEESDRVRLTLTDKSNSAATSAWEVGRSEVYFLQTLGGAARYLSDMEPAGYRHVPYLERSWNFASDRSVSGGPLRVAGKRYFKGIGMHSTSRLTFPLEPGDKRFAASIAIDDESEGGGSVTFRVLVDKEQRYQSEVVRGGQAPVPIDVDVSGGSTLSLVVDFADHGDQLDRADWLNARLLP